MDKTILDALYEDFEVSIKPGRGNYKYVKTSLVIDRLNKVFKGNWSTHVVRSEMIGDEILVHVQVCTKDDNGRDLSCHDGFGSAKKFQGTELGNLYKSAKSKAIKDAVKNWGVALFLDDDDNSSSAPSASSSGSFPPSQPMVTGDPVMPTVASTPTPVASVPTVSTPPAGNVPPTNVQAPVDQVVTPVTPPVASAHPTSAPLPSVPPAATNTMPTPPSTPTNTAGAPTGLPTMGVTAHSATGGDTTLTKITNVQEVAIQSKLDHKGLDFAATAKEMFESTGRDVGTAPATLKDLSYQDALGMVNFVTNK